MSDMCQCGACAGTGFADRINRGMMVPGTCQICKGRGWVPAIPLPFYWGLFPWIWRRLTGYRDDYGRKAQLFLPWQ